MVAVIDQRVIKCRFIGEFLYYSVSFLTIFFSVDHEMCMRASKLAQWDASSHSPTLWPQAALVLTLNSSMFSEGADKF